MRILLVADDIDDAHAVESSLIAEGHVVAECNDEFGGPCRGLDHLQECPLERQVDLAVIARSGNVHRSIGEMGSVCATRHRVGVIEIDPSQEREETTEQLAAMAERTVCHEYERAILRELANAGRRDGVYVHVHRHVGTVLVTVTLDGAARSTMSDQEIAALADRVRDATRHHDRFARSIDVSVVSSEH
jgi:hypothetical protein